MSCTYAHEDGAYVLGALDPAERNEFERHLSGCAECTRNVQQLAGLPGLLSRVSPEVLEGDRVEETAPVTLLPSVIESVRRARRVRRWQVVGGAVAASLALVAGTVAVAQVLDHDPTPPATPPAQVLDNEALTPVRATHMQAAVDLQKVAWGTRVVLTCSYGEAAGWTRPTEYWLVLRSAGGRTQQVASWNALPGTSMTVLGSTATERADITSVEVRDAKGRPVLRLTR